MLSRSWLCCLSMLHVQVVCSCCISMLHPSPCCNSKIHVHVAFPCCMSNQYVHDAFLCSVLTLGHVSCPSFMSIQVAEVHKANFKGPNCISATFLGHTSVTDSYTRNIVEVRTTVAFAQLWKYSLLSQNRNRITKKKEKRKGIRKGKKL
jgi:hypothetical protein